MYHLTKNKRTIQSAELIYEALCQLVEEKDFLHISVTELVDRAGVGRATFYRIFDTMEDVLRYKCDEKFKLLQEYIINYRKSNQLFYPAESTSLLKPMLTFWYLDSYIIEVIIKINRLDILMGNIEGLFESMFNKMEMDSENTNIQKDYFLAIRTGILSNILIKWVENRKNIPPDHLADIIMQQMQAPILPIL